MAVGVFFKQIVQDLRRLQPQIDLQRAQYAVHINAVASGISTIAVADLLRLCPLLSHLSV